MPLPLIGGGIKRWCCLTSVCLPVCLTSVKYIGPKSRTERPRKTNIGTEVARTRHTWLGHHFQGQKIRSQGHRGGHILWRPPAYSLLFPRLSQGGGIKQWRCLTSVCLSSTSGLSREQRSLGKLKLAQREPTSHVTRTPLSRSKGQRSTCCWCLK